MIDPHLLGILFTSLGSLLTVVYTFAKLRKVYTDSLNKRIQTAVDMAKQEAEFRSAQLSNEIHNAEDKIDSLRASVEKDMGHLKETYLLEIRNIDTKLDDLREEMKAHQTQLMAFLERMISKKY